MDDLIRRFREGDPDAVRGVYQRHAGAVTTVVRSIVGGDAALCADVVQQTFLKAWRAAHTVDADRDLAPWLHAIARRAAIDAVRHERRPTIGGHAPEVDVPVDPPSFERTWEAHEVRRALDDLPPDEREVLRLSHLLGMTHAEVAAHLGIPVGTVKSRSHRGHRRLAAALAHLQVGGDDANRSADDAVPHGGGAP
ncbi:RNA polymerase sigma factor [Euzebya sp.]|uniref:RNA polymerase sigma factor n=1 Tax=Euzebya sp. TaxID=1971409 RepID=UPI0035159C5D